MARLPAFFVIFWGERGIRNITMVGAQQWEERSSQASEKGGGVDPQPEISGKDE